MANGTDDNGRFKFTFEGDDSHMDHIDRMLGLVPGAQSMPATSAPGAPLRSSLPPGINQNVELSSLKPSSGAMNQYGTMAPAASPSIAPSGPVAPMFGRMGPGTISDYQAPRSTLGTIGHVAGTVGKDVGIALGSEFAPRAMPYIPGTPQYEAALEKREAAKEAAESDVDWREAQAERERAAAANLGKTTAKEKSPEEQLFDVLNDPNSTPEQKVQYLDNFKQVVQAKQKPEKPPATKYEAKTIIGPDGQPMQANYESSTGKYFDATGAEIENPKPYEKPPTEGKPIAGMINGKPAWAEYDPKTGWIDPETKKPVSNFQPPPSFAETGLWHEVVTVDPNGNPKTQVMNERTGQITDPATAAGSSLVAPGAIGGKQYQATVITNAGNELIDAIKQNKGKLGNVQSILNSAFLGTPLSDPASSRIAAQIGSFAALQPAMHGFRGQQALDEFKKMTGGLPNNPDSLIAAIEGLQKTAGVVAGKPAGTTEKTTAPEIGSDEHVKQWLEQRKR